MEFINRSILDRKRTAHTAATGCRWAAMILAGGAIAVSAVDSASAAVVRVTTTAELSTPGQCVGSSPCSLRAAFAAADANPFEFTDILIDDGIYQLNAPLALARGAASMRPTTGSFNKVEIVAQQNSRALNLDPDAGYEPYLVANGIYFDGGFDESGGIVHVGTGSIFFAESCVFSRGESFGRGGGAIAVEQGGYLSLTNVQLSRNIARYHGDCSSESGNLGGAVAAFPGSTVYITKSLFVENQACRGGAVAAQNATVNVESSTLYGNQAAVRGGALFLDGSAVASGFVPRVQLRFNTVHGNTALGQSTISELAYGAGLAISFFNGPLLLSGNAFTGNTLVARDQRLTQAIGTPGIECLMEASSPQINSFGNFFGTVSQQNFNQTADAKIGNASNILRSVSDCHPLARSSFRGIDSRILSISFAELKARGGSTSGFELPVLFPSETFNLLNNNFRPSPAASGFHSCPSHDTRGFRRPSAAGGICEIGAVEMDGARP